MPIGENRLWVVREASIDEEPEFCEATAEPPTPRRPLRRRRRALQFLLAVVLALAVAMMGAAVTHRWPFVAAARPDRPLQLVATLPYWNVPRDVGNILAHKADLAVISPWIYGIDDRGRVDSMAPPADVAAIDAALARLSRAGVKLVPTVANVTDGEWDYAGIIRVLRDPARRARHVAELVDLAHTHGYSGIDIDYENFRSGDRTTFTSFITELATALHSVGKTLSVDVFAKASDRGYDQRNVAQDYRALGQVADTVRVMAYDWHWSTSEPGPIAPITWVRDVLRYAMTQIPRRKIILGVPAYGYDWVGKRAELVSWLQAYGFEQKYGSPVHWDTHSQSPWLTYLSSDGKQHVVWFENAYSSLIKIALARHNKIGGAYLWLAGDEDDLLWKRLSAADIDAVTKQMVAEHRLEQSP